MKISILCPNISFNGLGRSYILAKMLQTRYQVEIIGSAFGRGIWEPLQNEVGIKIKYTSINGYLKPYLQLRRLSRLISGNVLYASKPLSTSYLLALLIKNGRPVVLDIDDWEWGFVQESMNAVKFVSRIKRILKSALFLYQPQNPYNYTSAWICEKLIRNADQITVSNRFLQLRYGGTIIRHGRDANQFVPDRWNYNALKKKYGIDPHTTQIMYIGTPRVHKGIDDLIEALRLIPHKSVKLAIVGVDRANPYNISLVKKAKTILGNRFRAFGLCSFDKLVEFIAIADVIVVPQRNSISSRGQMPAKIFDAMAMGKPIIATAVNDIPTVLDGCGWIVEPNSPRALADSIQEVTSNRRLAKNRGHLARRKFLTHYSWEAIKPDLIEIFKRYEV